MGYKGGGEGGHRFERIRLDSGPGNTVTVVCIEKGDVWRGLESIIHRAFYTPLLSLSLLLSLNHSPSLALYTISPFHLQGPVVQIQFYAVVLISIFTKEKRATRKERKGCRQPTTQPQPPSAATANRSYASALRIRFEDN